ncbi:MAG TPA: protocatechuate 3,4-dioxygenase subunit beta [Baekduia sp.]|uniref:dioxygenase family protein n=1 Tax=Baekduia sp. TaxID=2600305 RepID=UPI002D77A795|nr:protocatechuate 3,4-dioxygenase subunit beta [Baekduia sp.]HET6509006.1 protocatechuate 3,4-dioxygenase subunit beta [Baekduia sp.]
MSLVSTPVVDANPPYFFPDYVITTKRSPRRRLVELPHGWFHTMPGPVFGQIAVRATDNDLTIQHPGAPQGQRIHLTGRVLDSDGRGVPNTLIEIWQANAAGRYVDPADPGFMPLDPNFTGAGRCITDNDGNYRFVTIRPAAYAGPKGTMFRPSHIHFSLFGRGLSERLITQCYFDGDPLIDHDPIINAVPDPDGRRRLVATFDHETTPLTSGGDTSALAYTWDIVLRGRGVTPMEG